MPASPLTPNDGTLKILGVCVATCGFTLSCIVSGLLLHHPTLEIQKPCGRFLFSLGGSLFVAHLLFNRHMLTSTLIVSATCGAQNALATKYRGVVLRTTHLTVLFTNFGVHLGMKLRGRHIEKWKLLMLIGITLSFLAGAATSSVLVSRQRTDWILLAAASYTTAGLGWSVYKRRYASQPIVTPSK